MVPTRSLITLVTLTVCLTGTPSYAASRVSADAADPAWSERYAEEHEGPEQSETWSRVFKVAADGSLDVSNVAGTIEVTGGAGDEIKVEAVKRARSRDGADARRQLTAVQIEATQTAGRVEIRTNYGQSKNNSVETDFTISVPVGISVTAHSVSGDVSISRVKGEVRMETVSGNVTAAGTPHLVRIKSVSGEVEASDVASEDVLTAGSVSGNVVLKKTKARSVDLQSVSGDVTLADVACERAQARSVSGNIEFGGPLMKGGRYELNSHSGDITISIATTSGFELSANSFSGDINSDVKLTMRGGGEEPAVAGLPHNREVRGTFGDGSALLVVKTFSGDVRVKKADGKQ
jgi:DUF4097 and DUF4098 domain-containing protein YvlB